MDFNDDLLARAFAKKVEIDYGSRSRIQKQKSLALNKYFEDFRAAFPNETQGINFESRLSDSLISFSTVLGGESLIYIDGRFLGVFVTMNSVLCYKLSLHPDKNKKSQDKLSHFFCELVYGLEKASRFGYLKRKMVWHAIKFRKMTPFITGLTDGMILFMLCHELAHNALGHADIAYSDDQEIEADTHGLQYYLKLINNSRLLARHQNYSYILPYAPVLALQYMAFHAMGRGNQVWQKKSELLNRRQLNLLDTLENQTNEDEVAHEFYGASQSRLLDIQSMLKANL